MDLYKLLILSSLLARIVCSSLVSYNAMQSLEADNNTCWTQTICQTGSSGMIGEHKTNLTFNYTHSQSHCYPWMFYNETSEQCECSDIPNRAVLCDPTIPRTSILDCYCMTFDHERNELELGRCLYGCGHQEDTVYYKLPQNLSNLNDYTCGQVNRDSTLCGACKTGYSPIVYSFDMTCMNCTGMTYNWIKYIAAAYIPLTFFYFAIVIFRFSGTSPLLRGTITICQGIMSPICLRAFMTVTRRRAFTNVLMKIFGTIYGVWNLDFFRLVIPPICLDMSPLQALALDYAIAFYPFILTFLSYIMISLHSRDVYFVVCLWKPFHKIFHSVKKDWDIEGSVVKAFATFFMISYLKILSVTTDLLVYTYKYTLPLGEKSYHVKYALFFDASIEYFRGDHLYYGIIALLIGIFIVILPLVFLVIYPMRCFQRGLNACKIQRQSLDIFVNCYQGYYKDGTNGTTDFRFFSISFFLLLLSLFTLYTLTKSIYCYAIGAFIIMLFMFTTLVVQPYKEQFKTYSKIDAFIFLIIGGIFTMAIAGDEADTKAVEFSVFSYTLLVFMVALHLIYSVSLIIWWIFVKKNLRHKIPCCRVQESLQFAEFYQEGDIPDRIENPLTYQSPFAPLLYKSQESQPYRYGPGVSQSDS